VLQLDAATVAARLDRRELIDALDTAFRKPHHVPVRQQYAIEALPHQRASGMLLVMPAWTPGASLGIKLVTVFPDNAERSLPAVFATYVLLDAATGEPRAVLDGTELTLRRTGCASALAARYLAHPDAARLLMVGTGKLAPHLIESHALVRPIREVRIWGRNPERARALAADLSREGLSVACTDDLEAATRWADVVSCATLSRQPLVFGKWLRAGQHLDLVGAYTPQMCEVDDEAMARSDLYVDTRSGAARESGEIIGAIARGAIVAADIRAEFADLPGGLFGRRSLKAITLFKSVGTALEDLVAAELALR
jgi:ornithine cyclodeaminase